jgi:hypothetical protein
MEGVEDMDVMVFGGGPGIVMAYTATLGGAMGAQGAVRKIEVGSSAGGGEGRVSVEEKVKLDSVMRLTEKEVAAAVAAGAAKGGVISMGPGGRISQMKFEKPVVSETEVALEKVGEGPTIEGFPTEHYRMVQAATVKTKIGEQSQTSRTETTTDFYYSADLQSMLAPYKGIRRVMGQLSGVMPIMPLRHLRGGAGASWTPMPMIEPSHAAMMDTTYAKAFRRERAKLPKGAPMKTVVQSKVTTEGQTTITVATSSIENIRKTDLPASTWEVPSGYTNNSVKIRHEPPVRRQN